MTTFSLKVPSPAIVSEYKALLEKLKDEMPEIKSQSDALALIFKTFTEGFESLESKRKPKSIQNIIDEIDCNFLIYEELDFKCLEKFDDKKKPDILGPGAEREKILLRCKACKEGKASKIIQQYQKKLRGENITGILKMIHTFQEFAKSGVPSTIYFCTRIPTRQVITGKKTIHCGKVQMQIVPIDPTCTDPKCQHFRQFTIKVDHEFPKEAVQLIEGIAEDYARIEDLSPQPKKEVEAEQDPEGEEET